MSNESRTIQECVRILAGTTGMKQVMLIIGEVKEVDEDNRTCSVESTIDTETLLYSGVGLIPETADGFVLVPSIDSTVIMARFENGETYIIKCSDIQKINCYISAAHKFTFDTSGFIWNGGSLGGMVKVIDLTAKINALENKLNAVLTAIGTTWVPVANDGGAALKALFIPPLSTLLTVTSQASIEDAKIKH